MANQIVTQGAVGSATVNCNQLLGKLIELSDEMTAILHCAKYSADNISRQNSLIGVSEKTQSLIGDVLDKLDGEFAIVSTPYFENIETE